VPHSLAGSGVGKPLIGMDMQTDWTKLLGWPGYRNHEAIYRAIAGNVRLSLETEAPTTTVVELLNRPAGKETILHAVNFDAHKPPAPFSIKVKTQHPEAKAASVTLLSAEFDDPRLLAFTEEGGSIRFTMPSMKVHEMAVIAYR
jgi:hypothetical protein